MYRVCRKIYNPESGDYDTELAPGECIRRTAEDAAAYSDALNLGVEDFRKHWTFEQSPDCFDELGAELGLNSREIYRRLEEVTVEDFRDMVFDSGPKMAFMQALRVFKPDISDDSIMRSLRLSRYGTWKNGEMPTIAALSAATHDMASPRGMDLAYLALFFYDEDMANCSGYRGSGPMSAYGRLPLHFKLLAREAFASGLFDLHELF